MSVPTIASLPSPSRSGAGRPVRSDPGAADFAAALDSATASHDRGGRPPVQERRAPAEPHARGEAAPRPVASPGPEAAPRPGATAAPEPTAPEAPAAGPATDPATDPATPGLTTPDPTPPATPDAPVPVAGVTPAPVPAQPVSPTASTASTATTATASASAAASATTMSTGGADPTATPTTGVDATAGPTAPTVPSDQSVVPATDQPTDQQPGQQAGQQPGQPGGQDAGTGRGVPLPDGMTAVVPNETVTAATGPGSGATQAAVPTVAPAAPDTAPTATATTAAVDGTSATGVTTAVRTLDTGQVAAPAPPSRPPVVPDLATQLAPRMGSLRSLGEGVHRLVMRVQPENIGAVRVVAEITADSVRIELHGGTEQAREALRAMLPDLRRDLQGGDLPGQRAALDLGSTGRHGQREGTDGQGGGGRNGSAPTVVDHSGPVELVLSRVPAGRLDVLT